MSSYVSMQNLYDLKIEYKDNTDYEIQFIAALKKYEYNRKKELFKVNDYSFNKQYDHGTISPSRKYIFIQNTKQHFFFIGNMEYNQLEILTKWKLKDFGNVLKNYRWINDDVFVMVNCNHLFVIMNQKCNHIKNKLLSNIFENDILSHVILSYIGFEFVGSWLICEDKGLDLEEKRRYKSGYLVITVDGYFGKKKNCAVITRSRGLIWHEIIVDLDMKYSTNFGIERIESSDDIDK
eukprot:232517_1